MEQGVNKDYQNCFDNPFPGTHIPSFRKVEQSYGDKVGKAIYYRHLYSTKQGSRASRIYTNRLYANNNQNVEQYKERIDPMYQAEEKHTLWDNEPLVKISWRVTSTAKKTVNAIMGMITESGNKITINSLDHNSKSEREVLRNKLMIGLHVKSLLKEKKEIADLLMSEEAKILIGPDGLISNHEDVETYIDVDYKTRKEIGMEMLIQHNLDKNKYFEKIERRIIHDIIVNDEYCARAYFDKNNEIVLQYGDIAHYVGPETSDVTNEWTDYDGVYRLMTIAEVRNHLIDDGTCERQVDLEKTLFNLAKDSAGKHGNPNRWEYQFQDQREDYPWDDYRVEAIHFHYYTIDTDVYRIKKREDGNVFMDHDEKRTARKQVPTGLKHEYIKDEEFTVYEGLYVHQLGRTVNWGKQKNISRAITGKGFDIRPTKRIIYGQPGKLYGESSSIIEDCIQYFDDMAEHSYHIRKIVANHMPGLTYFDIDSLIKASMLIKKDSPVTGIRDLLKLAQARGIAIGMAKDQNGQVTRIPYAQIPSNLQNDIEPHAMGIIRAVQSVQMATGVNEGVDGSVQDSNKLVGVQELQRLAAHQVLSNLFHAYNQMAFKSIGETLRDMIQTQLYHGLCKEEYIEVLGEKLYQDMVFEADKPFPMMGIHTASLPSKQELARLEKFLELGIQSGTIQAEDLADISSLSNVKKTMAKLRYRSRKRREQEMQDKLAVMQQEGEENRKSAETAAAIHSKKVKEEGQVQMEVDNNKHKNDMELLGEKATRDGANTISKIDREGMHDKDLVRLSADLDEDKGDDDGPTNRYARKPNMTPMSNNRRVSMRPPTSN